MVITPSAGRYRWLNFARRNWGRVGGYFTSDEEGVQTVFREIVNANRPGVGPGCGAPLEFRVQAVDPGDTLAGEGLLHIPSSISIILKAAANLSFEQRSS